MSSNVEAVSQTALVWGALSFLAIAVVTIVLGKRSDLLRDAQPSFFGGATPPGGGQYRRPYSLAQTQMAWWFAIITGSFVFLSIIKGTIAGILNAQALILLGIGTGTGIGAALIEQTKQGQLRVLDQFQKVVAQLKVLPPGANDNGLYAKRDELAARLASQGFLTDILTDANGITIHRFQAAAWTLILGVIFVYCVTNQGAMPQFDNTVLTILGISGGTYLGLKIPEQPT